MRDNKKMADIPQQEELMEVPAFDVDRATDAMLDILSSPASESDRLEMLDAFLDYLDEKNPAGKQRAQPNTGQSFEEFRQQYRVLFEFPPWKDELPPHIEEPLPEAEPTPHKLNQSKHRRFSMRGLRILVAAVVTLASLMAVAAGSYLSDWLAGWSDGHFGFQRSQSEFDVQTTEDGTVVFPDGTQIESLPTDITPEEEQLYLEGKLTMEELEARVAERTAAYEAEMPDPDTYLPSGDPGFIEIIRETGTVEEVLAKYGEDKNPFPTWLPDGFEQVVAQVTTDSRYQSTEFDFCYQSTDDSDKYITFGTMHISPNSDGGIYEKDSRPVEEYTHNGLKYYLFYNLDNVVAVTHIGDYELGITGHIPMDEMKKMIDSIGA